MHCSYLFDLSFCNLRVKKIRKDKKLDQSLILNRISKIRISAMHLFRNLTFSLVCAVFINFILLYFYLKQYYFDNNSMATNTGNSDVSYTLSSNVLQSFPWLKTNINIKEHVGILIPSTTRMMKHPNISTFTLTKDCLPSLIATFEDRFSYTVYIGIGQDDFLQTQTKHIKRLYERMRIVTVPGNTYTAATNHIANQAFQDGMDYLIRINDDSIFETHSWTSIAIDNLKKYNPSNIGVVGPLCKQGNTRILTQDMVHRTHLNIFGYYYPPVFDNLWTDDWITNVYAPSRSKQLQEWTVKHLVRANGRRYDANWTQQSLLKDNIESDKTRLNKYIIREIINNLFI